MDGKFSKYKLRLSCSFMYLQLANLLLLNMCFEYHRAASESWYLEEDYPITTFFENNRFSSFFLQTEQGNSRFNYACGNATVETF